MNKNAVDKIVETINWGYVVQWKAKKANNALDTARKRDRRECVDLCVR